MNGSQLLYKISGLKYSIRRKEAEYHSAVKANDTIKMNLHNAELVLLKQELDQTIKELDAVPNNNPVSDSTPPKKPKKWYAFFTPKTAFNKK